MTKVGKIPTERVQKVFLWKKLIHSGHLANPQIGVQVLILVEELLDHRILFIKVLMHPMVLQESHFQAIAGFSGSLIWDGLTDDRNRNRVGIYIILFEAYNSASGKKKTFKETVVLAKMF